MLSIPLKISDQNQFSIDYNLLRKTLTPKTRMMVINTPNNPTGFCLTENDLEEL